jgi:hypothetical protein
MNDKISIEEAAARGIERLRQPKWVTAEDHLKIDIINGKPGPWTHLYAPFNLECNGKDPVDVICMNMNYKSADWLPYAGPIADSDEYRAAQARYAGCLSANEKVSDDAS